MTTGIAEGPAATPEVRVRGLLEEASRFRCRPGRYLPHLFLSGDHTPHSARAPLGVPRGSVILASGAVAWLVITWLYWALMESSSKQATVGKELLGIVVTDAEGSRMSFRKATVRHFGKVASALPVLAGFIIAGFTAKKQGLHDLITGSRVVMKQ